MTKSRPILFSAPMVRAIRSGQKTQTRRVWKEPKGLVLKGDYLYEDSHAAKDGFNPIARDEVICPYGRAGDSLWVRETAWIYDTNERICVYPADFPDDAKPPEIENGYLATLQPPKKKTPSILAPRWTSRIELKITDVRVERLQDISDLDSLSEGVDRTNTSIKGYAKERFKNLWKKINGAESWDSNPWVWVIEFETVKI